MAFSVFRKVLIVFLFITCPYAVIFADEETRATTEAEKAFSLRVKESLAKHLANTPPDWTVFEDYLIEAHDRVATDTGKNPFSVTLEKDVGDKVKLDAAQAAEDKIIDELAEKTLTVGSEAHMKEAEAKVEEVSNRIETAIDKGDSVALESLQKEYEALQTSLLAESDAIDKEVREKVRAAKAKDARLRLEVTVNPVVADLGDFVEEEQIGGSPVYRHEFSPDLDSDYVGEHVVFIGPWKQTHAEGILTLEPVYDSAQPSLVIQTIMIRIQGDGTRTRKMLEAMDWTGLKGLIGSK